jgi:hypothetical protein
MNNRIAVIGAATALCVANLRADIDLFEWGINQEGVITGTGDALPPGSVFDPSTGLGNVRLSFAGPGSHSGILFVDHELSETINTYFNEFAEASGSPPPGLSWEIDEPGFLFGNIFDNFLAATLDNSAATFGPEDVSMALGWAFALNPGEHATIDFLVSESQPAGFFLRHYDPDSDEEIFFSASLTITGGAVPDGGSTLALLAIAGTLFGLGVTRRK